MYISPITNMYVGHPREFQARLANIINWARSPQNVFNDKYRASGKVPMSTITVPIYQH
jgi:hypothetical protein